MDDQDILDRIQALVFEERRLRDESAGPGPDNADEGYAERRARLRDVEQKLDSFASLLRSRGPRGQKTEVSSTGNQQAHVEDERENDSSFVGTTDSPQNQETVNPVTDKVPGSDIEPNWRNK